LEELRMVDATEPRGETATGLQRRNAVRKQRKLLEEQMLSRMKTVDEGVEV
jgi:hypothetical protein